MNGFGQEAKAALSSEHWNVAEASLELNVNVGVASLVSPGGPEVIVVSGASTGHSRETVRR